MGNKNYRYEIVESMVKNTPNDSELGRKVRNFCKEEEQLDKDIDLEKYNKSRFKEKLKEMRLKFKKRKDD
jgi:hypothetical protein